MKKTEWSIEEKTDGISFFGDRYTRIRDIGLYAFIGCTLYGIITQIIWIIIISLLATVCVIIMICLVDYKLVKREIIKRV